MLLNVPLCVITFKGLNKDETIQWLFFGCKKYSYAISILCCALYAILTQIYLYLPINVFVIYYISICSDIKNVIHKFRSMMRSTPKSDFNNLCDTYNEIRSLVSHVDSEVGILIFSSFTYSALMMFMGISSLLNTEEITNLRSEITIEDFGKFAYFITIIINFFVQMLNASFINDASLSVKQEARKLKDQNLQFIFNYFRFLHSCEDEICMTLWGIANIKRGFVFGTFGTILTYTFLFDSLNAAS